MPGLRSQAPRTYPDAREPRRMDAAIEMRPTGASDPDEPRMAASRSHTIAAVLRTTVRRPQRGCARHP